MKKLPNMRAAAKRVLEHYFGKPPKSLKPIHGGLVNDVFEAHVDGEQIILRISSAPEKLQVFMKEQWAVAAAHRNKVPTPEILEVSNEVIGLPYMILRKVEGHPGGPVGHSRAPILQELGHYAARINGIRTCDFGHIFDWSPNKLSRNQTWEDYLDKELEVEQRLETLSKSGVLERDNLKKLTKEVQSLRTWKTRPTLCHGDLRLKNVILSPARKIAAIVDWEDCMSHIAPYWELSIALHDLTMDEKQSFLDGYGLDLKQYTRMAPAIKALNLLNYARTVGHALERKDKARLTRLQARLNGTFDLYSL
jgi:aminoglycoside phosphotransferase (APT) family kinase protein